MYLIKFLAILYTFLLFGCASHMAENSKPVEQSTHASMITEEQRNTYRNAITALNNNKLDLAENILKEFIDEKPNLAGPWVNLGLIYVKQNKTDLAIDALNKALKINPKQPNALNMMGVIEYNRGNMKQAITYYESALSSKPDYAMAHYNLALIYDIFYQNSAKAVEHYKRFADLDNHQDKDTDTWIAQLEQTLK